MACRLSFRNSRSAPKSSGLVSQDYGAEESQDYGAELIQNLLLA